MNRAHAISTGLSETSVSVSGTSEGDRLRMLMISRDFPPVSHSGTLRSEAFARYLPDFGVDPVIFTSRPGSSLKLVGLNTALAEGWRDDARWPEVRRVDWELAGVHAPRVASFLRRLPVLNQLESQAQRRRLVERLIPEARRAILENKVDVVFASAMPSETLLLAAALKTDSGLPVIGDLRDPWSYQPILPYRSMVDYYLERRLERRTLMRCDRVVVNTRQAQVLLEEELKIPPERVVLIRNGFDEDDFSSVDASAAPLDPGRFVILHAGQLANDDGRTRTFRKAMKQMLGLDYDPLHVKADARSSKYLLRALDQVLRQHPEMIERIRLWLVGMDQQQALRIQQTFAYPQCVKTVVRVDSARANLMISQADLLLLLQFEYYLRGRDYCAAIPAKLYSYLRAGRRILACVQPSEIAELVNQFHAGRVVAPRDVDGMSAAIHAEYLGWLKGGCRPKEVDTEAMAQFSRRTLAGNLAQMSHELASDKKAGR